MKFPKAKMSDGTPSHTLSFCWITLIFCLFYAFFGIIESLTIKDMVIKFRTIDSSVIMALLGPAFGLYGARRLTEAKYPETTK